MTQKHCFSEFGLFAWYILNDRRGMCMGSGVFDEISGNFEVDNE